MKTLTVRLPTALMVAIEAESRGRNVSKSDIVRERLNVVTGSRRQVVPSLDAIAGLIGRVDNLPAGLSARGKRYLKAAYGKKPAR